MKKSSVAWLFAVIVLSILLVISIILGMTGFYFSVSYLNSPSDIVVGDSMSISVLPNQSSVASFTFDGGYLPNEVIPQFIFINAQDLNSNVRVRVKAKVFGAPNLSTLDFVTTEHFVKENDGYYYFDEVLKGGNKVTFSTYLLIPSDVDLSSNEKYILTIAVETLDESLDYEKIWKNV